MPVIYHNFTETVKRKLVFVAPREAGYWRLWGTFDARESVLDEVERAKKDGYLVEIVVTDADADIVATMLHKRSMAFHLAGLGPDRRPPLPLPVPNPAMAAIKRGRPPRKRVFTQVLLSLPKKEPPATSGPSPSGEGTNQEVA